MAFIMKAKMQPGRSLNAVMILAATVSLIILTPATHAAPLFQNGDCGALADRGADLIFEGQYTESLSMSQAALECYQNIGDHQPGEGNVHVNIGIVYLELKQYDEAIAHFQQSLTIRRELGDRIGEGHSLKNIGLVYLVQKQNQDALFYYQQSLIIWQEVGNQVNEGEVLNNIGAIYGRLEQYDQALNYFQQSLGIWQKLDDRTGEGDSLNNIGAMHERLGKYDTALDYFQQSLAIWQELGDKTNEEVTRASIDNVRRKLGTPMPETIDNVDCNALAQTGSNLADQARYTESLVKLQEALTCFQDTDNQPGQATILNNIGDVYYNLGQYEKALAYDQQSLLIFREIGDRFGEAAALNGIGLYYSGLRRYEDALDYYRQSLTIIQEIGDQVGESTTLGNIGQVYQGLNQYEKALDYHQQSLTIAQEIRDLSAESKALGNIGVIYQSLGDYNKALDYFQRGLDIAQEISNRTAEQEFLNNIGVVYIGQGRYQKALPFLQQSLFIAREIGNQDKGSTLNNIGVIHYSLGEYNDALDYYQQSLTISQKIGHRSDECSTLNNIGLIYSLLGQYENALNYYQQSLTIAQEIGDQSNEGTALGNIGVVYEKLARYEEALDYSKKSLIITQHIGIRQVEIAALSNIGKIYQEMRQYEQALAYYQQSLSIAQEIGSQVQEGILLNKIGLTYYYLGQYEEALDYFQQSLTIQQELGDWVNMGVTLNNIGLLHFNPRQYHEALNYFKQSLAISKERGDPVDVITVLDNIGYIYEKQGNIDQAITAYQQAFEAYESIQGNIKIEELKVSFAGEQIDTYERLIPLLVAEERIVEAFDYAERARARAFLDQLGNERLDPHTGGTPKLVSREQELARQISALQRQLSGDNSFASVESGPIDYAALRAHLEKLQAEYNQILIELKLSNPAYTSLISVDSLSIAEIRQDVLDDQTGLLAYFVTDQATFAFALDRENLVSVSLPISRTRLVNRITRFRNLIEIEPRGGATQTKERVEMARELHQILLEPLLPHLQHDRLIIIPHQVLHYLPFAALLDEAEQPLAARFTLSTAPSASSLAPNLTNRNQNSNRLLVMGNPEIAATPLPNAEQEANAIASLYPQANLFTGPQASEVTLRNNLANADILHFATHSVLDPVNPLFSALLLTGEETTTDSEKDGRLEVREIFNLDLNEVNLVVLSACETALGEQSRGDELVGLTRAFFYAGAPVVVASLWPVEDEATEALMIAFHQQLRVGQEPVAALSAAQAEIRQQPDWAAPYYWASFIVIGNGDEEALTSPTTAMPPESTVTELMWLFGLVGVVMLVIAGGVMLFKHQGCRRAGLTVVIVMIVGCVGLVIAIKLYNHFEDIQNSKGWITFHPANRDHNPWIRAIEVDDAGNVWVGPHGEWGLYIFQDDQRLVFPDVGPINAIAFDANDRVWIATEEQGIIVFDQQKLTPKAVYNAQNSQLPHGPIFDLAVDGQGQIWAVTETGVSIFDSDEWTNKKLECPASNIDRLLEGSIAIDAKDRVWIAGDKCMYRFDEYGWETIYDPDIVSFAHVAANDQNIWMASPFKLWVCCPEGEFNFTYQTDFEYIENLTIDRHNRLWVLTSDEGAYLWQDGTRYNQDNSGIGDNLVTAVAVDQHDQIWLGLRSGISIFSPDVESIELPTQVNTLELPFPAPTEVPSYK